MLRNELFKPWFVGEDWGFEIVDGEFKEVCLQITRLEFKETETGNLDLEYHVVRKPEILSDDDLKKPEFEAVVEVIINDILREAMEAHEQARNNNTKESGSQ
jgi:hypothetical protein